MDLQKLIDEMVEHEREAVKRFLETEFDDDTYDYHQGVSDAWGVALNLVKQAAGV